MKTAIHRLLEAIPPRLVSISICAPLACHAGGKIAAWGDNSHGQCMLPGSSNNVKAISAGGLHSLALKANGVVVAWGFNSQGQTSVPANLSAVVSISAGEYHSLALRSDGTVVGWGYGYYGQTNVPENLSRVTAIAAGGYHNVALRTDGTVMAWGGMSGSYNNTNLPPGLSNVTAVAAGRYHSLALKSDGTVIAWGSNAYGQTNVPEGLSNVISIGAAHHHNIALKADGTVVSWGYNSTNLPGGLSDVVAISAGYGFDLALKADGALIAWSDYEIAALPAGITNVTAMACGGAHMLALVSEGPIEFVEQPANVGVAYQSNTVLSVAVEGAEPFSYKWLFNGVELAETDRITGVGAASLSIADAQFADSGKYTVIVSNAFGLAQSTGAVLTVISPPIIIQHPAGKTVIAGTNILLSASAIGTQPLSYQWLLGGAAIPGATSATLNLTNVQTSHSGNYSIVVSNAYGVTESSNALVVVLESPPYILAQPTNQFAVVGSSVTFAVNARGSMPLHHQWRFNGADIPGATNSTLPLGPVRYDQEGYYTVAIRNDFGQIVSVKAYLTVSQVAVWGAFPSYSLTNPPAGLTNLTTISAGDYHLLGLKRDGRLVQWGVELIWGPLRGTNAPPALTDGMAIATSSYFSLALRSNGNVVAWGYMERFVPSPTNVPAGLSNVIAVAAGDHHALALKSDGTVVAWGYYYPEGFGVPIGPAIATNVPSNVSNVIAVSARGGQSLALRADGTVVAWGAYGTNAVPNVTNIIAVAAGNNFNLALQEDGKVIAWPQRSYPIIIFPPYPFPTPLPIPGTNVPPGLSNVVAIAAGSLGMALNADGSVAPWATNLLPSGLTNAFAIAVGRGFFAALVGDGAPSFTIQPVSRTAGKGETVRFVSRAVGVQPVNYHWRFNGADIPGATNGTLVLTNVQGRDAGTYQVHALNSVGVATSIAARLTIPFNTNLAFALNATNLVWTTSPTHAPWFAQIQEAHDGDVAAQSGAITHGQQSILQTTVNGPGTLTFWWKVSSEEGYDFLKFQQHVSVPTFAPIPPVSISGETGWQSRTVVLFPSTNRLEWVYWKDNTVSVGRDAGWVDEVVLTPAPPSILLQPASQVAWRGSSVTFTASAICGGSPNYQWLKNGTDLPGRCTPSLTLTNLCRRDSGTYTLRVSNSSGTAISSNATLRVLVAQRLKEAVWQADGSLLLSSGDIDGNPLLPEDRPSFEFQASTNLVNWVPVLYPPWVSNGALWALDYDVYEIPTRFYRVVEH